MGRWRFLLHHLVLMFSGVLAMQCVTPMRVTSMRVTPMCDPSHVPHTLTLRTSK